MNYIRLIGIFSCLCLWHFGTVAPQISIQSRSSSSSRQTIDGQLKTVYDFTSQHDVNDISGKLVHTRKTDFKSDFAAPVHKEEVWT